MAVSSVALPVAFLLAVQQLTSSMLSSLPSVFLPQTLKSLKIPSGLVGALFGCYSISQLVTTGLFIFLSRVMGRKFALYLGVVCEGLFGMFFGLSFLITSNDSTLLPLLFVCRIMQGIAGGMTASLIYAVALERSKGGEGEVGGLFSAFNSLGFLLGPPIGGVLFQVGGVSLPFAAVGGFVLLSTPLLPWLLRFPSPGSATQTAPTETSEVQGNLREGLLAGGIEVEPRLLVDSIEDKGEGGTVKYGRKAREGFCESDLEGCVHAEGENNSKDPQSGIFSLLQDPYQLLILTTEVLCCLPWGFLEPLLSNHLQRGLGVKDSRVIGLVWMVPSITLLLFSWPVGRLTDLLPTAWQEKEVSIGLLGMAAGLYLLGVADELGSSFSLVTGSESKSDSAAWGLTLGGLLLMGASFNVTTVPLTPLSVKAVGVGEEEGELQGEETDRDKEAQKGSHPAEATTPAASLEVRHGQPGVDFESAHVPSTALTARVGSNLVRSVSGGSGRRVSVGAGDSGGIDGVVAMGAVSYGLGEGVGPMIGGLAGEYFSFSESCKLLALSLVGFSVAFFCAAPLARNRGEVQRTI